MYILKLVLLVMFPIRYFYQRDISNKIRQIFITYEAIFPLSFVKLNMFIINFTHRKMITITTVITLTKIKKQ